MTAAFNDMTSGEALAESRGDDHGTPERKAHLAAMRVARQRQRDAARHVGEDIRLVRQQDDQPRFGAALVTVLVAGWISGAASTARLLRRLPPGRVTPKTP